MRPEPPLPTLPLTEMAGIIQFMGLGLDLDVQLVRVSTDRGVSLERGAGELIEIEIITSSTSGAREFAHRHGLDPDYRRAATLGAGTEMWSGWVTNPNAMRPIRCVVFARDDAAA